jgi:hypothetical protein
MAPKPFCAHFAQFLSSLAFDKKTSALRRSFLDQDASQLHDRGPAAGQATAGASLDHLVRAQKDRRRDREAELVAMETLTIGHEGFWLI